MTAYSLPVSGPWWRGATVYQIYPRSFQDSNGDGIGDLAGITARLDYVADLGVDAIWISPFFTSPMHDFGYDVSDYCGVDPIFGSLADFDRLTARAHELGVKVLIDQVYSHCSDEHPWFSESRQSRENAKNDWFVWADAKPDGSPPNNWQGVFGGPAWTWDARRRQYYMHNFLPQQPQLNLHNPDVQQALLGVARFWLERGVDGFRIDAINFAMHDPRLRDNPPAAPSNRIPTRPFDFQAQLYNQFHPATVGFLERIRLLTDEFGGAFTLGEIGGDEENVAMRRFTEGDSRLNSAYGFDFLYAPALTPKLVYETQARWPDEAGAGWPSWAFENHDAPRALSRWSTPKHRARFARLKMLLLLCLRGNPILYQGEELGLLQDDIPFEHLQDREAIANWPLTLSRDGVRTPMPWTHEPLGDFTTGTPWLPFSDANRARAVAVQQDDPASLLSLTCELLSLRKAYPSLRCGSAENWRCDPASLAFDRVFAGTRLRCLFNLSDQAVLLPADDGAGKILFSVNDGIGSALPPFAGRIELIDDG